MDDKSRSLRRVVEIELKKAEKNYLEAKKAAEEIAASAQHSLSQAGDRDHSQGTADLLKQKLDTILALKNEIEMKKDTIAFIFKGKPVYVVDYPVIIQGFTLISTSSEVGKKLLNGKE